MSESVQKYNAYAPINTNRLQNYKVHFVLTTLLLIQGIKQAAHRHNSHQPRIHKQLSLYSKWYSTSTYLNNFCL